MSVLITEQRQITQSLSPAPSFYPPFVKLFELGYSSFSTLRHKTEGKYVSIYCVLRSFWLLILKELARAIIAERGLTCAWSLFLILLIIQTATTTSPINKIPPKTDKTMIRILLVDFTANHVLTTTELLFKLRKETETSFVPPVLTEIEYCVLYWLSVFMPEVAAFIIPAISLWKYLNWMAFIIFIFEAVKYNKNSLLDAGMVTV